MSEFNNILISLESYLCFLFYELPNSKVYSLIIKEEKSVNFPDFNTLIHCINNCRKCSLFNLRTNPVPGQGPLSPDIMFIGEAPGYEEDLRGLPFVGNAGQLLTKMITAMGYRRDEVYICNIIKCRPPNNRLPLPSEIESCILYLHVQIQLVKPKVIILLGSTAVNSLFGFNIGISKLRGKWLNFHDIPVMPTYHPSYLLRNVSAKKDAWLDLQCVINYLNQ